MEKKQLEPYEFAELLNSIISDGFNVIKVARAALDIYSLYALQLTPEMDEMLMMLMAMEEGPEFELSETEILHLIDEARSM